MSITVSEDEFYAFRDNYAFYKQKVIDAIKWLENHSSPYKGKRYLGTYNKEDVTELWEILRGEKNAKYDKG